MRKTSVNFLDGIVCFFDGLDKNVLPVVRQMESGGACVYQSRVFVINSAFESSQRRVLKAEPIDLDDCDS